MASGHHRRWGLGLGEILLYVTPDAAGRAGRAGVDAAGDPDVVATARSTATSRGQGHQPAHPGLHPRAQGTQHVFAGEPPAQTGIPVALGSLGQT